MSPQLENNHAARVASLMSTGASRAMEVQDGFRVARDLMSKGVPIGVARPNGRGDFVPRRGWEHDTGTDPSVLDTWREGDALFAVTGVIFDGLDVDKQNGGDTAANQWTADGHFPRSFGRSRTASGGTHDLIALVGVGCADGFVPGVDLKGGRPDGSGRGMLYLPPTRKISKTTGEMSSYRWEVEPALESVAASEPAPSAAFIADLVRAKQGGARARQAPAERTTRQGATRPQRNPLPGPLEAVHTEGPLYIQAAVRGEIETLRNLLSPWRPGAGWDAATHKAACNLFEIANTPGSGLTQAQAKALIEAHAPTDNAWTAREVQAKIAAAHATVGAKVRRNLPLDVVAEMEASVAPDAEAFERGMWAYAEGGYDRPVNRPAVKRAIREGLRRLQSSKGSPKGQTASRELQLISLENVVHVATEWAVMDQVPLGTLTGLAGWAGIGKSTLVAYLAAGITRGTFEGDLNGRPSPVLIVAGEDDIARQLAPRLSVAGADMSKVHVAQPTTRLEDGQSVDTVMQLSQDLPALRMQLVETGAKLLVLDPILSFVDGNPNDQADVRRALDPIAAISRELNIAVIVVMHFKKGHGVAGEKVSGSHVWRDALRSLLVMAIDEESQYRVVTVDKSNYSDSRGRSLLYEVTGAAVQGVDSRGEVREQFVSKARYIGESPKSVQDLLESENNKRDGRHAVTDETAEVVSWVRDQDEPVSWVEIARQQNLDPNAKDPATKRALVALSKRLGRACERGDLEKASKGLYRKPSGLQPLSGLGAGQTF